MKSITTFFECFPKSRKQKLWTHISGSRLTYLDPIETYSMQTIQNAHYRNDLPILSKFEKDLHKIPANLVTHPPAGLAILRGGGASKSQLAEELTHKYFISNHNYFHSKCVKSFPVLVVLESPICKHLTKYFASLQIQMCCRKFLFDIKHK